jgi:hypothetical protein
MGYKTIGATVPKSPKVMQKGRICYGKLSYYNLKLHFMGFTIAIFFLATAFFLKTKLFSEFSRKNKQIFRIFPKNKIASRFYGHVSLQY